MNYDVILLRLDCFRLDTRRLFYRASSAFRFISIYWKSVLRAGYSEIKQSLATLFFERRASTKYMGHLHKCSLIFHLHFITFT